jgi:hypothetical protein
MQSSDKKILIPIDDDPSTTKAVSVAVRRAKEWMAEGFSVSIVLVNLYSEWDILGRDESNGKLAMDQAESFVTASGVRNRGGNISTSAFQLYCQLAAFLP